MAQCAIIRGYAALSNKLGGRSRVQIYRDIKAGKLPAPFELGPNSVAWFEAEVDEVLASRRRRTYAEPAAKDRPAVEST